MRVFLPSTLPALAQALRSGQVGSGPHSGPEWHSRSGQDADSGSGPDTGPVPGFAVTPALREAYASGDEEELEYAALTEAARASLRLLAENPAVPPRRVVLAAELRAEQVKPDARDDEPARVLVITAVPLTRLVSAHVDDAEAVADVRAAAGALPAADSGDEDAQFTVDGAEGHELGWYATQELPDLTE
jgi:hypothetical protein